MSRKVLGRGLEALIPKETANVAPEGTEKVQMVPVDQIRPNARQPRQRFDDARLEELARSVREKGIIEPLIVRPGDDGGFELVAGERRLRAAQRVGQSEVPVLIRECRDRESLEIALIENLQREDLNPVDEARAYLRLAEEFGRTHAEISQEVGKDRSTVTNLLRLLRLPEEVLEEVSRGTISVGHGRVLLAVEHADQQIELCRRMVAEGWNVRQAEKFVSKLTKATPEPVGSPGPEPRDRDVVRVEEALRYALGAEVYLDFGPKGGRIEIRFEKREELERILERLGVQVH